MSNLARRAAEKVLDGDDASEAIIAEAAKEIESVTHADELRKLLSTLTLCWFEGDAVDSIEPFKQARALLARIAEEEA